MKILANCGKLQIRQSPVEGYGVFATDDIPAGTILEEVPFVLFPRHNNISEGIYNFLVAQKFVADREKYLENLRINLKFKNPDKYYFKWHPQHQLEGESMYTVLPLGNGPIYNSSNTDNNADWKIQETTFLFRAERYIIKDEEIRTFYGYFLGDDGTTFNCDLVYNFAMDTQDGKQYVKNLRFGAIESMVAARNNPANLQINNLIQKSQDGILIKKMSGLAIDGKEIATFNVPDGIPLTQLYGKLAEFKVHGTPLTGFVFEYVNKEDGKTLQESVVIKK
jgi:hypothetical protein